MNLFVYVLALFLSFPMFTVFNSRMFFYPHSKPVFVFLTGNGDIFGFLKAEKIGGFDCLFSGFFTADEHFHIVTKGTYRKPPFMLSN